MSDTIIAILFITIVVIFIVCTIGYPIYQGVIGNKMILDTNFEFVKAITYIGNEKIELKVKKWTDYEGEQIQIVTEEGKVYLLSTYNTILVSE